MDIFSAHELPSEGALTSEADQGTAREAEPITKSEVGRSTDPATPLEASAETVRRHSLDHELDNLVQSFGNVGASLNGWWGSVRKQSAEALMASRRELETFNENARKDLAPLLNRAKDGITMISEQAKNTVTVTDSNAPTSTSVEGTSEEASSSPASPTVSFYGEVITPLAPTAPGEARADDSSQLPPTSAFFNRLQTQIAANPNIANLSRNLPNIQQIQSQFQSQLSKLPPLSEGQKLAEDYLHKSELYLERAGKEFGTFINHAVRVVPPNEAAMTGQFASSSDPQREDRRRQASMAAAGRKDILLRRLRSEPAMMLVDPALPPPQAPMPLAEVSTSTTEVKPHFDARESFAEFLKSIETAGGWQGEMWRAKIDGELALADDQGVTLKATFDALVPSKLTAEAFWTRYFFRVQQIEEDEARRRQVLEGAAQQGDDDFKWDVEEDEDEGEETPVKGKSRSQVRSPPSEGETESWAGVSSAGGPSKAASPIPSVVGGPISPVKERESPRNSSEEGTTSSYDVVSRNASGSDGDGKAIKTLSTVDVDEGEDSDWE